MDVESLVVEWRNMGPVRWAEHEFGYVMENGKPIVLTPWQRAVLEAWWAHKADVRTLAISNVKKTGKTTLDSILLAWRWLTLPDVHFVCANDLDQGVGRQFKMISEMTKRNPLLKFNTMRRTSLLRFKPTSSTLEALSVSSASNAGANFSSTSHTECWGIQFEESRRNWEELSPPPAARHGFLALRIADSYAGWEGESELWHSVVDRGLQGDRLPGDWPLYKTGGLLLFHLDGEEARGRCFRGTPEEAAAYYADERASLRPNAFSRLHGNTRSSSEDKFILPDQWDALIAEGYRCPLPDTSLKLTAGLDLATKHDSSALVSIYRQDDVVALGPYRIWPAPCSLEAVEEYILWLHENYDLSLHADPFQAILMIERLTQKGVKIEEFAQTVGNLTLAGNALFDLIKQRQLVVYPCDDLRAHALNAQARQTARGIRLVKDKATRKIDAAIGLAIAAACLQKRKRWVSTEFLKFSDFRDDDGAPVVRMGSELAIHLQRQLHDVRHW